MSHHIWDLVWAHVLHVPPCFPTTYCLSLALATPVQRIAAGWGERGLQSIPSMPACSLPWQRPGMGGHDCSVPFPSSLMGAGISGRDERSLQAPKCYGATDGGCAWCAEEGLLEEGRFQPGNGLPNESMLPA